MRRRAFALFLAILLIFEIMGLVYPVKGELPCTPDHPCHVTTCGRLVSGYYILDTDMVVSSIHELVPIRDMKGSIMAFTCLYLESSRTSVVLNGNNHKIILEPGVKESVPVPLSAIRISYGYDPESGYFDETPASTNTLIGNVTVEGWDIGIDMASSAYSISGLDMEQIDVVPTMINTLISNSTFRNNHFGVAITASFSSDPTQNLWGFIFSGITLSLFENNSVAIWMRDSHGECCGDQFLIGNNTIKNNTYGIFLQASSPPLKPEGEYSHTLTWIGPSIRGNTIEGNFVGIELLGSKSVKIVHNMITENVNGIQAERSFPEQGYNMTIWTGRSDNLTIVSNTIRDNVRGVTVTEALSLNLTGNRILDNDDLYWMVEIPSPDGNGTIRAYNITWDSQSGWGAYLYKVSNSLIAKNEIARNGIGPLDTLTSNVDPLDFTGALIDIGGENNTIRDNYIHDNAGIGIWLASKDVLERNRLEDDYISVEYYDDLGGSRYWRNFKIKDTTVNGKPVVVVKNRKNYVVDDAAQVFVFNSRNVRIENLNWENAKTLLIFVENSSNVELRNVSVRDYLGKGAVFISRSSGVSIRGSLFGRSIGPLIGIKDSGDVTVEGNTFSDAGGRALLLHNTTGVRVEGNVFDLTGGISGVNVRDAKITNNGITRSMFRTYVTGYGIWPMTEGEVWPITAGPFTGMAEMDSRSNDAAIALDGSGIVIEGNRIAKNVMGAIYIPSGEDVTIEGNRIENNTDGGLLLGETDLISNEPTLKGVVVRGNKFTNNGLSLIGDFRTVLYDGSSSLFNYYLRTHNVPVSNIVVEDNIVNGKPLIYLENAGGVEVMEAGQIIAINSSLAVSGDIPFTDMPVFAFNSEVSLVNSTLRGRAGAVFLASNVTVENSMIIHGYEGMFTVYDSWELSPRTVRESGLIGEPWSGRRTHGIDVEMSELTVENTTIRHEDTLIPVPLDEVHHTPSEGFGISGASLIRDGRGNVTLRKVLVTGEKGGLRFRTSAVKLSESTFQDNWISLWAEGIGEASITSTAFLNSSYSAITIESLRESLVVNNVSVIGSMRGISIGITFDTSENGFVSMTNSRVRNVKYSGILIRGAYRRSMGSFRVENSTFENAGIGVEIEGSDVFEVRNVTILHNRFINGDVGIKLTQTVAGHGSLRFMRIENNTFANLNSGLVVKTPSIDGAVITDNEMNLSAESENGIYLSAHESIQNLALDGNTILGALRGITLEGKGRMTNITVRGNLLMNNNMGLSIIGDSYEEEVRNVTILCNSFLNGNTGVMLTQSTYGRGSLGSLRIEDNRLLNLSSGLIVVASSIDGTVIKDNTMNLTGDSGDGIRLSGQRSIQDVTIDKNAVLGAFTGIKIEGHDGMVNVTVRSNLVVNNTLGLSLIGTSYGADYRIDEVTVYNNYFDNGKNVEVDGIPVGSVAFNTTATPWRNIVEGPLIGGNYWADYTNAEDRDMDGFADEPYNVAPGFVDYLPLVKPKPVVIENATFPIIISEPGYYRLEIDGEDLSMEYAILINSSNVLLDGDGHTIEGGKWALYGTKVVSAENVTITNLRAENWMLAGVYAEDVSGLRAFNISVTGNTAEGIDVRDSRDVWIALNNLKNLSGDGIYLKRTLNSTVEKNRIENVRGAGVELDEGSMDNLLRSNVIEASGVGLYLRPGSGSNTIRENILTDDQLGVYVFNSSGNIIYDNYLDSERNAKVVGSSTNSWNTTKTLGKNVLGGNYLGGNYWSDYSGEDINGDGIGDTPYTIDENNTDYLPLTMPADTSPPEIKISNPANNSVYNTRKILVHYTVTDENLLGVRAYLNGKLLSTEADYSKRVTLNYGWHNLTVTAWDKSHNVSSSVIFRINEPPTVKFTWSANHLVIHFSSNVSDPDGVTKYLWDFGDGETSSEADPVHAYKEGGVYTVTLTVWDSLGLSASVSKSVEVFANVTLTGNKSYTFERDFGHYNETSWKSFMGDFNDWANGTLESIEIPTEGFQEVYNVSKGEWELINHSNYPSPCSSDAWMNATYERRVIIVGLIDHNVTTLTIRQRVSLLGHASKDADREPPVVEIIKPLNTTYKTGIGEISVKVRDDSGIVNVTAEIDGVRYPMQRRNGTWVLSTNLGKGHHRVVIAAYDSCGNGGSASVEFTISGAGGTTVPQSSTATTTGTAPVAPHERGGSFPRGMVIVVGGIIIAVIFVLMRWRG
jgi:parallel beta-helix repeat protein